MKKYIIFIIVFFVALGFLYLNLSGEKVIVPNSSNSVYEEVSELLRPVYSDYQMEVEKEYHTIRFTNSKNHEVEYLFYEGKISSVDIHYDLNDNSLSSDETIQNIEKLYGFVTNSLIIVKDYFDTDFYLKKEFYINDHDKSYLKDLLDYNVEYSGWNVGYYYKNEGKYLHIDYYLSTRYDNEGYSSFSIYLS